MGCAWPRQYADNFFVGDPNFFCVNRKLLCKMFYRYEIGRSLTLCSVVHYVVNQF